MNTKFKIVVETGQGRDVYPAEDLQEAIETYREQLATYPASQIHLLRDMPVTVNDPATKPSGQKVEKHGQIDSKFLRQQTEGADTSNPLYEKVVVMSGTFEQIGMERDQVAETIQKLGAKLNRGIGPTVGVFITGNKPGPSKLKEVEQMRADGRDIRIISQLEFKEIADRYIGK